MKTIDYLEAVRGLTETGSDYAVAKSLGISRQKISGYMNKGITMGPDVCERVAQLLGIPLAAVLADMEAERAKRTPVKEAWEKAAELLRQSAAVLLLGLFGVASMGTRPADAALQHAAADLPVYVLCALFTGGLAAWFFRFLDERGSSHGPA